MSKHYNVGLYLGRFQPLHIGHECIIQRMLRECDKVIIAIGSAQESGTVRNPLSCLLRRRLIEETFWPHLDRLIIIPIHDREHYSDDSSWGDYLFEQIRERTGLTPDVVYEGDESTNKNWYDNLNVDAIKIPRSTIRISGTELRLRILNDDFDIVRTFLPKPIYKYYYEIRKEIQNAKIN